MRAPPSTLLLTLLLACGGPEPSPAEPEPTATEPEAPDESATATGPGPVGCYPVSGCLCWDGCALLRVDPDGVGATRLGPGPGGRYTRDPQLTGHEVCDAEGRCEAGFDATGVVCEESCPPSRAPFACRPEPEAATGPPCVRVDA